jgi:para-aminobenzoate synthetase/4-amino-4-deoxychorismate lyase
MKALLLFESLRPSGDERLSFRVEDPEEILQCSSLEEVAPLLREAEARALEGWLVAGFVTYEGGYAFVPGLPAPKPAKLPMAWFAVTRRAQFDIRGYPGAPPAAPDVADLHLDLSIEEYRDAIAAIKGHIERGETYQVNLTARYRGRYSGSPLDLYGVLRTRQRVNYAALIQTPEWAVVSLSPELFFRKDGDRVSTRPMKGTAARGRTLKEDEQRAQALRESPKETSENLMIVDMLRNDLGRICVPGSIEVSDPMRVERYETLLQMTTTVQGRLLPGAGIPELFRAAFPSASVTGAPKVRTMQIVHSLERTPRGVYTGAIGYLRGNTAAFSVAIRTVAVQRNSLEMGVGSGILYEADPDYEYRECELKGKFLSEAHPEFQLLETMLWTPSTSYADLALHLERILESAEYFVFDADRAAILRVLQDLEPEIAAAGGSMRVRLLLHADGAVETQHSPLEPMPTTPRVCFASMGVHSSDRFLFHKTTRRALYHDELRRAKDRGCFDALFQNESGDITEGAISNVAIRKGDLYLTPPVECGLLSGTCRRRLLEAGRIRERKLQAQDLLDADEVYLMNALRGMFRVELDREGGY